MARIVSWSSAGVDPSVMGTGPIPASRKALDKAGWDVSDLDLIESNEAFAAQSCAVNKEMGWDVSKVGPVTDKIFYDMAKTFATSVGKGEVQAKHGNESQDSKHSY